MEGNMQVSCRRTHHGRRRKQRKFRDFAPIFAPRAWHNWAHEPHWQSTRELRASSRIEHYTTQRWVLDHPRVKASRSLNLVGSASKADAVDGGP
jgi:hypothetical protein